MTTTTIQYVQQFDAFTDTLLSLEQQATATADEMERKYGEFSRPHSYWLDIRASLRNTIETIASRSTK